MYIAIFVLNVHQVYISSHPHYILSCHKWLWYLSWVYVSIIEFSFFSFIKFDEELWIWNVLCFFSWSVVLWKLSQSPLGFLLIDLLIYFWKNLSQKGNPTEEGFQSRSLSSESSLRMETVLHNHKYQRTGHWTETTYSGLYSCI